MKDGIGKKVTIDVHWRFGAAYNLHLQNHAVYQISDHQERVLPIYLKTEADRPSETSVNVYSIT
jgi:hypothetical protein